MNIGSMCHASLGGSARIATELAAELARRSHTVHLFTRTTPFGRWDQTSRVRLHRAVVDDESLSSSTTARCSRTLLVWSHLPKGVVRVNRCTVWLRRANSAASSVAMRALPPRLAWHILPMFMDDSLRFTTFQNDSAGSPGT